MRKNHFVGTESEKKFDISKARDYLRNREFERKKNMQSRRKKALLDFERIVAFIIQNYNPTRIYQWGSLLDLDAFTEISDIDIAIEGLHDPLAGLKIQEEAESMTDFPVDIVELDRVHPAIAEDIKKHGILRYERN